MTYTVFNGDCIEMMRLWLADNSVQTCVTSPPYFGLRDYGVDGQIGLEETPSEYIEKMVDVFREVRRVMREDGTLWLNLGDSYANVGKWGGHTGGKHAKALHATPIGRNKRCTGLKPKDLIGIPWRVALALQEDGWYLRQDIIWHKPNPMPESVRDRCTKAHEYLFMLSKSPRYFYDHNAIKEPTVSTNLKKFVDNAEDKQRGHGRRHAGFNGRYAERIAKDGVPGFRNRRSVWSIAPHPYKGAHFATFPPALVEPCILAGSRPGDTVLDPFGGSGTTAQVAITHGRKAILCELNPSYLPLIDERVGSVKAA